MGGGGAMRTAATKVATYGINAVGLRGPPSRHIQELPTSSFKPSPPAVSASVVGVVEDLKTTNKSAGAVWDDWDFTGSDEEQCLLLDPKPRVVFPLGGVPSFQEAKEATLDLKEALHKEYFANSSGCNKSSTVQESALLRSGHSETKACITSESAVVHSAVPKPVFHAFSLLTASPEAQGVVASLASDKNVWDAVMQNEKVMDFIKRQQNSAPSDSDADIKHACSVNKTEEKGGNSEGSGNEFMEFVEKVKIRVTDIISSLSGFFQSIFGGSAEEKISMDDNGNATVSTATGASFMALAVLAIMVAVLKRG